MASRRPLVNNAGQTSEMPSGDFVSTAALGSGTANSSTFLRGDQTYAAPTAQVAISSVNVAFTDGDTVKYVNIVDAGVTVASTFVLTISRADIAPEDDPGYVYIANVIRTNSGSFDVVICCTMLGEGLADSTPPNETVRLQYTFQAGTP